MIKLFLRDLAEEVAELGDGAEALAAYREFAPDWVVMDIEMDKLDGLEATRQIVAAFPLARIVMLTQYDDLSHCVRRRARPALRRMSRRAIYYRCGNCWRAALTSSRDEPRST